MSKLLTAVSSIAICACLIMANEAIKRKTGTDLAFITGYICGCVIILMNRKS